MFALCIEASHGRGLGHLFRALRLRRRLVAAGREVVLLVNDDADARLLLERAGVAFEVVPLYGPAGWEPRIIDRLRVLVWVNDRLDTDAAHAAQVVAAGVRLATFDDRGDGAALADLNVVAMDFGAAERLQGRNVLCGIEYLVLDEKAARWRSLRAGRDRCVVTLGGSDTYGATVSVVRALAGVNWEVTVITGPAFQHEAQLATVLPARFQHRRAVPSLLPEFGSHDFGVTGGGVTVFEACATGLPCIGIANEPHEVAPLLYLQEKGCVRYAGTHDAFDPGMLLAPLDTVHMNASCLEAVPVDGVDRVCDALLQL